VKHFYFTIECLSLQGALGIYDLGQFHFKPLKDSSGSIVLTTVCNVKDPKAVILSSSKWVSFAKLLRRSSGTGTESQESLEVLVSSVSVSVLLLLLGNTILPVFTLPFPFCCLFEICPIPVCWLHLHSSVILTPFRILRKKKKKTGKNEMEQKVSQHSSDGVFISFQRHTVHITTNNANNLFISN
jgi:hypothetical protein